MYDCHFLLEVYTAIMDAASEQTLAYLIRETRVAALGTIHDSEPNLAMVAVAHENDFSAFYIHVSKLGKHTGDMELNPRVSLLITETDDGRADPQTLTRLAVHGIAEMISRNTPDYSRVKDLYLKRFPEAEQLFNLGDFNLWKITPKSGRFVAGFGRAFNIVPDAFMKVSRV
jgi:putative heme iron utilization protein